jgi:hypothetical protein
MAITVPVVNTPLSVSGFGKPVADQINALIPTPWQSLTLINGWTAYTSSGRPATAVRRFGELVLLRVSVQGGTSGTNIAQLPVGYRPGYYVDTTVSCGASMGFLNIAFDGQFAAYVTGNVDTSLVVGSVVFSTT